MARLTSMVRKCAYNCVSGGGAVNDSDEMTLHSLYMKKKLPKDIIFNFSKHHEFIFAPNTQLKVFTSCNQTIHAFPAFEKIEDECVVKSISLFNVRFENGNFIANYRITYRQENQ